MNKSIKTNSNKKIGQPKFEFVRFGSDVIATSAVPATPTLLADPYEMIGNLSMTVSPFSSTQFSGLYNDPSSQH